MLARTRSRIVPLLLSLVVVAGSLTGCRKGKTEKPKAAEIGQSEKNSLRQSLDGLKPLLSAQDAKFAALRKQVEALPYDLEGFGPLRAKFYATEEGRGIMGVKLTWLSGRLETALKSGNREELTKVSKDIGKTYDEMHKIDQLALELMHQLPPFERMAAQQSKQVAEGR